MRREERKHQKKQEDIVDPITMEPIVGPAYLYIRPNGSNIHFDAETLADYILKTGDFRDPTTRIDFSQDDLKRPDNTLIKAGVKRESTMEAMLDSNRWQRNKVVENEVLALERFISELVSDIYHLIEQVNECNVDAGLAEEDFLDEMLPEFQLNFELLKRADPSVSKQCMEHYMSFLKGPPNKETGNREGFRNFVIRILRFLST